MSTHNIGFYEDLTKPIFELSSNIMKYTPYFFCCCFSFAFEYLFLAIVEDCTIRKCSCRWLLALLVVCQCRLLITLANSLDPDQVRRIFGPDQGPNCLTF